MEKVEKMEKSEYRAVIKFFVLKGLTTKEIHNELKAVLKEKSPSFPTVHRWALEFRRGRTSVQDVPRAGRPKTAITDAVVHQIQEMIVADHELTEDELAQVFGISHGSVHEILTNILGMKKISGKWENITDKCKNTTQQTCDSPESENSSMKS